MTKGEAITQIYALFNAPHNADINIVGLNKVLDDLRNSHPEQEPWPEEPVGHMAGGVRPSQRTWLGLTNAEVNNIAAGCHLGNSVQDAIFRAEAKLKEKNTVKDDNGAV